ncbi:MAG TPA: helix-turn-helix domain-containing protein [Streptosporangiaceae bacterium]
MTLEDSNSSDAAVQADELRRVDDVRTLRALAHPVRIALIEALSIGGPMTATQVGEQIGESPTTCSFHLRQLAKYGFVEEAGGGKGRARPWRMTSIGFNIVTSAADTESDIAARTLLRLVRERQLDRYRTWLDSRASYPASWQDAATESEYVFYLTPAELTDLKRELNDVLMPWLRDRLIDQTRRPAGSLPVELLLWAFPIAPAGSGTEAD